MDFVDRVCALPVGELLDAPIHLLLSRLAGLDADREELVRKVKAAA